MVDSLKYVFLNWWSDTNNHRLLALLLRVEFASRVHDGRPADAGGVESLVEPLALLDDALF